MSETVASVLLNAAADRTRGAWPQSMRARAEKTSAMPRDMCTRREAAFESVLTSRRESGTSARAQGLGSDSRALHVRLPCGRYTDWTSSSNCCAYILD